jgi:hypothetical protein
MPNYARPAFSPAPKPAQRKAVEKAAAKASKALTRRQCVEKVWIRAKARCERCGALVKRKAVSYATDPERGDVNEIVPKSKGGDPCDPRNCELVCGRCHFGGPSGAHAPTKARMTGRRTGGGQ